MSPGSRSWGAAAVARCSGRMRCTFDSIMRCAIVGSGLAALATYATLRHGGVAAEEIAVFGTHDDPTEVWRTRAAAIRQRRMRSESDGHLAPAAFPGLAVREAVRAARPAPLLRSRRRTATTRASTSSSRTPSRVRERTGWDTSFREQRVERVRAVDGGFDARRATGRSRTCSLATGHPGLARPRARGPRRGARLRAARLRGDGRRRRRRHGRGDGVAERARRGRRGRLDPAARAAAPAAERAAPVLLEARPRRLPRAAHRASARATLRELSTPSYPPGPRWDEPLARPSATGRFRVEAVAERRRAGDLRDGLPPRLPARRAAARPRRRARPRDARPLDRARRPTRPSLRSRDATRTLVARRRRGPVGVPRRRHARRARSTPPWLPEAAYVVHADRPPPVAPRRGARCRSLRASLALHALVGRRARRADARGRARARRRSSTTACSPTSPAGPRCRSALVELGARRWRDALRSASMAPLALGARALRARLGRGAARSGTRCFPRLRLEYAEDGGELGPARRAGRGRRSRRSCSAGSAPRTRSCRRRSTCTATCTGPARDPTRADARRRHASSGGIVIRANHVTLRNVTVIGGENGIDVTTRSTSMLDDVRILGVTLDGIHVRRSAVMIKDCTIASPNGPWRAGHRHLVLDGQGDERWSRAARSSACARGSSRTCRWSTSRTTTSARRRCAGSPWARCRWATIEHNDVLGAHGVGIICVDHSECSIEHNTVVGHAHRPDR